MEGPRLRPPARPPIWIATVPPDEADGLLLQLCQRRRALGNHFLALSLWPGLLATREQMEKEIMSAMLEPGHREMLMVLTAVLVGCKFCSWGHSLRLRQHGLNEEQIAVLKRDYRCLELDVAERAMLDYSAVLTVAPWRIEEGHVRRLSAAGFDDRQILEINQICSFMNMITRTNHGLGVRPPVDSDSDQDIAALRAEILDGTAP